MLPKLLNVLNVNTQIFKRFKWYYSQKDANTCMTRCFCPKPSATTLQSASFSARSLETLRITHSHASRNNKRFQYKTFVMHKMHYITCKIYMHFVMTRHLSSDARSTFHHIYCQPAWHNTTHHRAHLSSYHDCNGLSEFKQIPPLQRMRFNAVTSLLMQLRGWLCPRVWIGFEFVSLFLNILHQVDAIMPFGNTHNQLKMNYTAEQEYPDLSKHNNHMAKVLTLEMYANLRDKQTPSGFTLDDVIQTGVDNPGKWPNVTFVQNRSAPVFQMELGCRGIKYWRNWFANLSFAAF